MDELEHLRRRKCDVCEEYITVRENEEGHFYGIDDLVICENCLKDYLIETRLYYPMPPDTDCPVCGKIIGKRGYFMDGDFLCENCLLEYVRDVYQIEI